MGGSYPLVIVLVNETIETMKFSIYRVKALALKCLVAVAMLYFLMVIRNVYFPFEPELKSSSDSKGISVQPTNNTNVFNIASKVSEALENFDITHDENTIEDITKDTHETTDEDRSKDEVGNKGAAESQMGNPIVNQNLEQNNQFGELLFLKKKNIFNIKPNEDVDHTVNQDQKSGPDSTVEVPQSAEGAPEDFIYDEELNFRNKSTSKVYVHGHDYPNKELCPNEGEGIEAIIVIPTSQWLRRRRDPIRRTWGTADKSGKVVVAFLSGKPNSKAKEADLQKEMDEFGDIIIDNIEDSYTSLPLKIISILEWVGLYCSKATYVLKADDDVFINIDLLKEFIEEHKARTDTIFGRYIRSPWPSRITSRKCYVSREEYPSGSYPPYVTGPCYMVPVQAAKEIYSKALTMPYFRFEDIFLMGMVAEKLNVKREHSNKFCLARSLDPKPCYANQCIAVHNVRDSLQLAFFESMNNKEQC